MFVMHAYSLSNLSDSVLLRRLADLVARDRVTTAAMLAHIAEVDSRRLYLPAAYPSMHAYCVHELHLSEDAAYRRITAARTARQFPAIFDAIAEGDVSLSAVGLLAPHLTAANVNELLKAAAHRPKSEVDRLIAERFPQSEILALVTSIPPARSSNTQLVPERVGMTTSGQTDAQLAQVQVDAAVARARLTPIASQRFALQFSIGQSAYDKLRYAQELLSHQIEPGDLAGVFECSLDALIVKLENRKFSATSRPQNVHRPSDSLRNVPAHVQRAVWERDGGRCTFVSETGTRCPSRTRIEFDHVDPVALGGEPTVQGMRLRCRAHNQFTAECTFGAEFMRSKREEARRAAAARKAQAAQRAQAAAAATEKDVTPWLRQLGFRADEARLAAAHCADMPDASLEERVRKALAFFHPRAKR